jgi:hypothetical protein
MKFLKQIGSFLKRVFTGAHDLLKDKGYIAVMVTEQLKNLINSPVMDVLTSIIPGEVDNLIVSKLRITIPKVAYKVARTHGVIKETERPSQALILLFDYLKTLPEAERAKFWIDFAGNLTHDLEDGNISVYEAIRRTQDIYRKYFQK